MDVIKIWAKLGQITCAASCCILCAPCSFATNFIYPDDVTAPYVLDGGDNLTVVSGNMQTTTSSNYTVLFNNVAPDIGNSSITVDAGATLSYAGTIGTGVAIASTRNDTDDTVYNITNNGTISTNTSVAIKLSNSNGINADDTYNIFNTGTINGGILTSGVEAVHLTVSGASTAITGPITLGIATTDATKHSLTVSGGTTFSPNGINDIGTVSIIGNSTLNLSAVNSDIGVVTIANGSTLNVNSTLSGDANAITNSGTMNISADINKTGTFTAGSGTNVVKQAVTVATSNYTANTHIAYLGDEANYGNMTLTNTGITGGNIINFNAVYGNGFFAGGTYQLFTATSISGSPNFNSPSSTLFLSFSSPFISGNSIYITLTRTPFNSLTSDALAQSIGSNLEFLGSNSPNEQVLSLLNAVEASTTSSALEFNLLQLGPLTTAQIQGLTIQSECLEQAELRLASLRMPSYYAGDIDKDNNLWIRGFGNRADQKAKDDSFGYYASSGGFALGYDRNFDVHYTIGLAAAYVHSHVDDKINPNSITGIQSYMGMIYGSYNISRSEYVDWLIGVIGNSYSSQRIVNINGFFQTATAKYDTQQLSFKATWGNTTSAFGFVQFTPMASILYTFVQAYDYQENNAGAANLNISLQNNNLVQIGIGAKVATPVLLDPAVMMPEIYAMYLYNAINAIHNTVFNFAAGGTPMISAFELSRSTLDAGVSLSIAVLNNLDVKFNYGIQVQDRYFNQGVFFNLRYSL